MRAAKPDSSGTDAVSWALNLSSSVAIVFVNKVLLDEKTGYGFRAATTLSGLHFIACAISIWLVQLLGLARRAYVPWTDIIKFALVANISIASLNASLLVNTVGFYQVAKLLITPCVCLLDVTLSKKRLILSEAVSILLVVAGVALVSVTDVQVSPLGFLIAIVSVLSSSLQQILCGTLQRKHHLSSHQLLSHTACLQGAMLLLIGPHIDRALSQHWVLDYTWTAAATQQLALSCALAVLVNLSQFMCLGRFSPVTFQVLGHSKTILVLLTTWFAFGEQMTDRKLLGISMAVAGIVTYGVLGNRRGKAAAAAPPEDDNEIPSRLEHSTVGVTAHVSLGPSRVTYKQASATGLLASYPITVSDDDIGVVANNQTVSGEPVHEDLLMPPDESIAANVKRRRRGAKHV